MRRRKAPRGEKSLWIYSAGGEREGERERETKREEGRENQELSQGIAASKSYG